MRVSFKQEELMEKIKFFLIIAAEKILLEAAYYYFISPKYDYMGFGISISIMKCFESYVLLCMLFICTPVLKYNITVFFLNIQLVITIVPMLAYYWMNDQNRVFMYAACICHLFEICLLKCKLLKCSFSVLPSRLSESCIYEFIIIFACTILAYCIFKYGKPQLDALDFSKVYEIRADISWKFPFSYFIPWCAKVFIPLGITMGFYMKKYVGVAVLQISLFILYLQFSHKSFLFTIIFVTAVYTACRKNILYKAVYLTVPAVTVIGMLICRFYGSISPLSYLVRRVLFVPAQLKFAYYSFFSQNPKYMFADGQIGRIFGIKNSYELSIARTIGNYMGNSSSANTGYLGESYAQAGFLGMFVFSILIVVFLKIIEELTEGRDDAYIIAAVAFWLYNLNDATFLTGLLTGGGIMFLIIFALQGRVRKGVWIK